MENLPGIGVRFSRIDTLAGDPNVRQLEPDSRLAVAAGCSPPCGLTAPQHGPARDTFTDPIHQKAACSRGVSWAERGAAEDEDDIRLPAQCSSTCGGMPSTSSAPSVLPRLETHRGPRARRSPARHEPQLVFDFGVDSSSASEPANIGDESCEHARTSALRNGQPVCGILFMERPNCSKLAVSVFQRR